MLRPADKCIWHLWAAYGPIQQLCCPVTMAKTPAPSDVNSSHIWILALFLYSGQKCWHDRHLHLNQWVKEIIWWDKIGLHELILMNYLNVTWYKKWNVSQVLKIYFSYPSGKKSIRTIWYGGNHSKKSCCVGEWLTLCQSLSKWEKHITALSWATTRCSVSINSYQRQLGFCSILGSSFNVKMVKLPISKHPNKSWKKLAAWFISSFWSSVVYKDNLLLFYFLLS